MSILERIAGREHAAFVECIDRYGALVWSLARQLTRTPADAEDCTQEIFLQIWRHADRYDAAKGSEATFIAMISRRRLIDRLRVRSSEPVHDAIALDELEHVACPSLHESSYHSLDAAVAVKFLSFLRPDCRRVLELAFLHNLSHEKIAQQLDMPMGTVKSYARRGLLRLRKCLTESDEPRVTVKHVRPLAKKNRTRRKIQPFGSATPVSSA